MKSNVNFIQNINKLRDFTSGDSVHLCARGQQENCCFAQAPEMSLTYKKMSVFINGGHQGRGLFMKKKNAKIFDILTPESEIRGTKKFCLPLKISKFFYYFSGHFNATRIVFRAYINSGVNKCFSGSSTRSSRILCLHF